MPDLEMLAALVDDAARGAEAIPQITATSPELSVDDGYKIQALSVGRRLERGEKMIGIKMGLTSRAKMQQVKVDQMIWGRLTDAMQVAEGGQLRLARYIHPRVEPEIAFILRKPLSGAVGMAEAAAAIEAIAPALEIIDSRYRDFQFTLVDVVADNSSASAVVLGPLVPYDRDIGNLGMILTVNGRPVQIGSSAAILGHPLRALVEASRLATLHGGRLAAGDIVLAGAATAAEPLSAGTYVCAEVRTLGRVGFSVE